MAVIRTFVTKIDDNEYRVKVCYTSKQKFYMEPPEPLKEYMESRHDKMTALTEDTLIRDFDNLLGEYEKALLSSQKVIVVDYRAGVHTTHSIKAPKEQSGVKLVVNPRRFKYGKPEHYKEDKFKTSIDFNYGVYMRKESQKFINYERVLGRRGEEHLNPRRIDKQHQKEDLIWITWTEEAEEALATINSGFANLVEKLDFLIADKKKLTKNLLPQISKIALLPLFVQDPQKEKKAS